MTTVLTALNTALHQAFVANERVILLGEDLLDPYGGAFKVAQGLSTLYPQRVLSTPISEAGILGMAVGMALRGLRPIVEIMFGDFITLGADALINHASKFRWMYADQVRVPLVLRTPMGGRRGYGPTHSQSLEKLFLGVPGLHMLAPAPLGDPGALLLNAILETQDPLIFVENKLLYLQTVQTAQSLTEFDLAEISPGTDGLKAASTPTYRLQVRGAPAPSVTIAAYGYMSELARQALLTLAYEQEIFAELIVPTRLAPVEVEAIQASAQHTGRLLLIEEGTLSGGWGAEVAARVVEALGPRPLRLKRLAGRDLPIPASTPLEAAILPGLPDIVQAALGLHHTL